MFYLSDQAQHVLQVLQHERDWIERGMLIEVTDLDMRDSDDEIYALQGPLAQLSEAGHTVEQHTEHGSTFFRLQPPLPLDQALRTLLADARSENGVNIRGLRAANAAAAQAQAQVAAFQRIVAELQDDGISDEALDAAEATVRLAQA